MNEEIGSVAGLIWHALETSGGMTLAKLRKEVGAGELFFDWAIGWLAREDKIELTQTKRTFQVSLKGWHGHRANAA